MDASKTNRQLAVVERLGAFACDWLGGRDSNPDNVVQRLGERPHFTICGRFLRTLRSRTAVCEQGDQQDSHKLSQPTNLMGPTTGPRSTLHQTARDGISSGSVRPHSRPITRGLNQTSPTADE